MNRTVRQEILAASPLSTASANWLDALDKAMSERDKATLETLFTDDAYWRDLLATSWDFGTTKGPVGIAERLTEAGVSSGLCNFRLDPRYTAPSRQTRAGREVVEAIFAFDTSIGKGNGVVRLQQQEDGRYLAWGLMTSLQEIDGYPEAIDDRRPERIQTENPNENCLDQRDRESDFSNCEPEVLIVGAGQCGLMIAARLKAMGVRILMVDRVTRVGDNWRERYHTLQLHNELCTVDFPYTAFPRSWPSYLPKDLYATWMEFYSDAMLFPFWNETNFDGAEFDDSSKTWRARLTRNGESLELRPQHIVLATGGVSGRKFYPKLPGLDRFEGTVVHSSDVSPTPEFRGKKALVVGTSTSGHDIALELLQNGCDVTMVQRSPTNVVNMKQANLVYSLYKENRSIDELDIVTLASDYDATIRSYRDLSKRVRALDADLIAGLENAGFRTDPGYLEGGHFANYLHRGGGYYINVGASERIIDGSIKIIQASQIEAYGPRGAEMKNGDDLEADIIVLATGYLNQEADVRDFFGEAVAKRVGPVWGWGEDGEMRGAWRRTGQEGLWLQLGGITQARTFSKFLALQIVAQLRGVMPAPANR